MSANLATAENVSPLASRVESLPRWCIRTEVSLRIDKEITFDDFEEIIARLRAEKKSCPWAIGDALVRGERLFGEDWAQVVDPDEERQGEETGETFRQYMQVAGRIPVGSRLPKLS